MQQSKWLSIVVRRCFPHPQRFHQVWSVQTGSQPLFIWEPVPPSDDYVALGMIATLSEATPPSVKSVHCVPREWVDPSVQDMKMLWGDAGASGKPGSLWAAGSLQLLVGAPGHHPPKGTSWELRRTRFTLGDTESRLGATSSGSVSDHAGRSTDEYDEYSEVPPPPDHPRDSHANSVYKQAGEL